MKLSFIKVNPAENMTIFIMDKVSSDHHMNVANMLMDYNNIHGEQVGFIEEPRSMKGKSLNTLRLQMMGGEFCGNATRSLAALMVHLKLPSISKNEDIYNVTLETSGSEELISCQVRLGETENSYYSKIKMPLPERIINLCFEFQDKKIHAKRVDLPGITHFIVDNKDIKDRDEFFHDIKVYMYKEEYDAFGIMFYDYEKGILNPLVYVRKTDSLYWERSCASGTAALIAAVAKEKETDINDEVRQPGGILQVSAKFSDGKITELYLDGSVDIVAEGIVYI